MIYNFCSSGSKLENVHASLLKIALRHSNFSKNFTISGEQQMMAVSDGNFFSEILLNGCFSKTAAKIYLDIFILEILGYTIVIRNR